MAVTLFDTEGLNYNEAVSACQTVNKGRYVEVLFRLVR